MIKAFGTDEAVGLTTDEVYKRRQEYGSNELPKPKPRPWWVREEIVGARAAIGNLTS